MYLKIKTVFCNTNKNAGFVAAICFNHLQSGWFHWKNKESQAYAADKCVTLLLNIQLTLITILSLIYK